MNEIKTTGPIAMSYDKFSWKRVTMVARYWWPRLSMEFWIFLGYSVLSSVAAGCIDSYLHSIKGSLLTVFVTWMAMLGAAVFGQKRGRELDVALPARNDEKITFYIIYSLIIIPLITTGVASLLYWLINEGAGVNTNGIVSNMKSYIADDNISSEVLSGIIKWSVIPNMLSNWAIASIVLYCSTYFNQNAILKSVGIGVACYIIPAFLLGIGSGIYGFYIGLSDAAAGIEMSTDSLTQVIMETIFPVYVITESVIAIATIVIMLWCFIRRFPKRQSV